MISDDGHMTWVTRTLSNLCHHYATTQLTSATGAFFTIYLVFVLTKDFHRQLAKPTRRGEETALLAHGITLFHLAGAQRALHWLRQILSTSSRMQ